MAADDPNTVALHERDDDRRGGEANGTIRPGDLIELDGIQTSGAKDRRQFVVHSTAEERAVPRFALEYAKTGRGIDDDYSSGDDLEYRTFQSGEEVYAWLADGDDVSAGALLSSNGDGALTAPAAGEEEHAVAEAVEAVAASGSDERIRVEVV